MVIGKGNEMKKITLNNDINFLLFQIFKIKIIDK